MPHMQLVTSDGDAPGPIELEDPDPRDGTVIDRDGERFQVVGRLEADHSENFSILVVEQIP